MPVALLPNGERHASSLGTGHGYTRALEIKITRVFRYDRGTFLLADARHDREFPREPIPAKDFQLFIFTRR